MTKKLETDMDTLFGFPVTPGFIDVAIARSQHRSYGFTDADDDVKGVRPLVRTVEEYLADFRNWCPLFPGVDYVRGGPTDRARGQLVKAASVLLAAIDLIDRRIAEEKKEKS